MNSSGLQICVCAGGRGESHSDLSDFRLLLYIRGYIVQVLTISHVVDYSKQQL